MDALRRFSDCYPVAAYVLLCFSITWSVWFSIPAVAGDDWTLIKILTGVGLGPGLAAVLLDRLRRGWNERDFTRSWWVASSLGAAIVVSLHVWNLMAGDGRSLAAISATPPSGISIVGVGGALLSGAVSGFIFATARASSSKYLNSITGVPINPLWWPVALFLPALLYTMGIVGGMIVGSQLPDPPLSGVESVVWLPYLIRVALFCWLVVAIGEEPGWRGYMLPELQSRFSPLVASIILGVVWGVWHLPLFVIGFYPGDPLTGTLFQTSLTTAAAILFTWMFNRTGGLLSLVMVLHLAFNTTSKVLPFTWWGSVALLTLVGCLVHRARMWEPRESRIG